jgi:hypothetical protein
MLMLMYRKSFVQISYIFLPGFDIQAPGPSASVGRILQFR